ncbi:Tn7 transposition protein C [Elysia marginata]|uniref:Tn7 transposition protein C n=1 Tax=Elysia marginata TaxID=1093978 RepID=A0AAV4IAS4_9GAST|nr:Tn7 transposition protein C [Elysia marginata]
MLPLLSEGKNDDGTYNLSRDFKDFMEKMWAYKWIEDTTELPSEEIMQAFYKCTAGIRDYIIKLYQIVQIKLIYDHERGHRKDEIISPDFISETAKNEFHIVIDKIEHLAKHPHKISDIDDMGFNAIPEITKIAEKFKIAAPEEKQEYQEIRNKVSKEEALINKLQAENIDSDRATLIAKCIINQHPDAKDQLRLALNLDADPEFGKQQAPYIKRKPVDLTAFNTNLFRACKPKKDDVNNTYDNLRMNGLTTNLRDFP